MLLMDLNTAVPSSINESNTAFILIIVLYIAYRALYFITSAHETGFSTQNPGRTSYDSLGVFNGRACKRNLYKSHLIVALTSRRVEDSFF